MITLKDGCQPLPCNLAMDNEKKRYWQATSRRPVPVDATFRLSKQTHPVHHDKKKMMILTSKESSILA